ncbi:MAG: DUF885 domain-containing protein [Bacteroidota bacterium]
MSFLFFPQLISAQTEWQISTDSLNNIADDQQRMHQLFEHFMDWYWQQHPESATRAGINQYNDQWTDLSLSAYEVRRQDTEAFLQMINTVDTTDFPADDQLNYTLFRQTLERQQASYSYPDHLIPLSNTVFLGKHHYLTTTLSIQSITSQEDYEQAMMRLQRIPIFIDQLIALMNEGLRQGILPPRITVSDIPDQVQAIMGEVAQETLLSPFRKLPNSFTQSQKENIKNNVDRIFQREVKPAYQKLHDYLIDTYIPQTRSTIGLSALPNGQTWYQHNIQRYTTTSLTAEEIHQIGLSEVKRIREAMDSVIRVSGFEGSFDEFTQFLRTDPQFYHSSAEDLLAHYRDICKQIDPQLIGLFGKLPRMPYGVKAIPEYTAKTATTAYYNPGSYRAARPGYFYANTYDLASRPIWEMEALTLHEAVPGHHLQIALSKELDNVPMFRETLSFTAFVEGWALYAESLGETIGLYQNPYSKFGQLTYEMWRAIRLVVDTGIHAKGWTRDQAIDFFQKNSAKTEHDIAVEVDRYIAWPGQALAYKVGELKIKELRSRAESQLGEAFNVRVFHDALLEEGALPLDMLEAKILQWIENQP